MYLLYRRNKSMKSRYNFAPNGLSIKFDIEGERLSYGDRSEYLSLNVVKVLNVLLEKWGQMAPLSASEIAGAASLDTNDPVNPVGTNTALRKLRSLMEAIILDVGLELPDKDLIAAPSKGLKKFYQLNGTVTTIPIGPVKGNEEVIAEAIERVAFEKAGGREIHLLTEALQKAFPDTADIFSYTRDGVRLPVYMPNHLRFPDFPIDVDRVQKTLEVDRNEDSLFDQRSVQGASLYPGTIYTLKHAEGRDWQMAWTVYTDLIDSCDYISARLKEHWARERDADATKLELIERLASGGNSDLARLGRDWHERAALILDGKWARYTAGMAFSVPTFKMEANGSLSLLCAEGSPAKQAGAGQKHVCPAGMFEFFECHGAGKQVTLSDFRAVMAKELLEETLFGSKFEAPEGKFSTIIRQFSTETPGQMNSSFDRILADINDVLIPRWDEIWASIPGWQEYRDRKRIETIGPGLGPLRRVLAFDPKKDVCFTAVDATVFRPELIVPIYQTDDLFALVNWEMKDWKNVDAALEVVNWEDHADVEDWVRKEASNWCAPGLTAAYLGAMAYFDNPKRHQARSAEIDTASR
jgi:hypothetical protein